MSAADKMMTVLTLVSIFALSGLGSAAPVMFENRSGPAGLVDVYLDGQPVARSLFATNITFFPFEVAQGEHTVEVRQAGRAAVVATGKMTFSGVPQWITLKASNSLKLGAWKEE